MKIELIPPHCDKSYSLQFTGGVKEIEEIRKIIILEMYEGILKKAHPFLQGDSEEWLMIEFWTSNFVLIKNTIEEFLKKYEYSL